MPKVCARNIGNTQHALGIRATMGTKFSANAFYSWIPLEVADTNKITSN